MLHAYSELGAFRLRQFTHELLFGEEVIKSGEPSVAVWARLIRKPRVFNPVLSQPHASAAGGAAQAFAELASGSGGAAAALVDELKQGDGSVGRKLRAFPLIKPQCVAVMANVNLHRAPVVAGQRVERHQRAAVGAMLGRGLALERRKLRG